MVGLLEYEYVPMYEYESIDNAGAAVSHLYRSTSTTEQLLYSYNCKAVSSR